MGDNVGNQDQKGFAVVYKYSSGSWLSPDALNRPENATYFGQSVSLSENGNTAIVGDYGGGTDGNGSVHVYKNVLGAWSEPTAVTKDFGGTIDISADGNVIVVGDGAGDTNGTGSVSVYRWVQ